MTMRGWESYVPPGAIGDDGRVRVSKGPKYGNRKTTVDGITFDSAKEARRWNELRMLEKAGEIRALQRQVRFDLEVRGVKLGFYLADFAYQQQRSSDGWWMNVIEDVKSTATKKLSTYRLKKRLMLACHGIEIHEV